MDHVTSFKTKIMAGTNQAYNGTASKTISELEKQVRTLGANENHCKGIGDHNMFDAPNGHSFLLLQQETVYNTNEY
jgi:hypothetical protein